MQLSLFPPINMAAEALVSPIVELLLGKLGSFVNQQVSLISGVKNDLEKLKTTLTTIKTGLIDAEKQQLHNSQVGDWLEKLKDVCYDAEDLFDEFQAEALRRQVLAEHGSIPKKVCNALSWPKSLAFRFNIGHKIKELRESATPTQSFVESCISMFPFLRFLDLSGGSIVLLPKKLGNLRHLRYLNLGDNGKIKKLPNSICKLQSLQTLLLGGCEELQELPRDIRYLISLRCLDFSTNQKFLPHNGIGRLDSLRTLYMSCTNLEYLLEDIGNLKALRKLVISNCPNLVSLPSSIKRLSSLETLYLWNCEKLNLDWGRGMEEEDSHQDLNGTRPHLRQLWLSELPKLVELPQWLLRCSANSLQFLAIFKCPNLLALPDSLQNLKSLQVLRCPKVSSLPQDMHGLTTLEKIEIWGCPTLSERCEQGSGEDWPQIAHVPNIWLDGDLIIK
ncbi:hypothetical protein EZV62_028299 [Acer yangbiense]|uniref:Uncharacterized protein n=1 Tax=Acer yangbiense TaxID=1000413 RepID=A0A5C7GN54_9ROSI|nr:hypothetical protein EZV62_028299 [Acer yangbiense]